MKLVLVLATASFAGLISLLVPAFAAGNTTAGGTPALDENTPVLNKTGNDYPLLEQLSDKGNYLVRIAWPQVPLSADKAFDLQIFFLDPRQPTGTNGTSAAAETNSSGSGKPSGSITVPDTMQRFVDVESFDITIHDKDGNVLWQKLDQPARGGEPGLRIQAGNYTGPVTIDIADIRPGAGTSTAGQGGTDSVQFSASIAPEFPLALVPLMAALAAAVLLARFAKVRPM